MVKCSKFKKKKGMWVEVSVGTIYYIITKVFSSKKNLAFSNFVFLLSSDFFYQILKLILELFGIIKLNIN